VTKAAWITLDRAHEHADAPDVLALLCARRERPRRRHAATPPSAASNSRRPMVTVIRPSRSRCVKRRIPRHERAVLTLKEGRMLVASVGGRGFSKAVK
jgi:hypothetical protein